MRRDSSRKNGWDATSPRVGFKRNPEDQLRLDNAQRRLSDMRAAMEDEDGLLGRSPTHKEMKLAEQAVQECEKAILVEVCEYEDAKEVRELVAFNIGEEEEEARGQFAELEEDYLIPDILDHWEQILHSPESPEAECDDATLDASLMAARLQRKGRPYEAEQVLDFIAESPRSSGRSPSPLRSNIREQQATAPNKDNSNQDVHKEGASHEGDEQAAAEEETEDELGKKAEGEAETKAEDEAETKAEDEAEKKAEDEIGSKAEVEGQTYAKAPMGSEGATDAELCCDPSPGSSSIPTDAELCCDLHSCDLELCCDLEPEGEANVEVVAEEEHREADAGDDEPVDEPGRDEEFDFARRNECNEKSKEDWDREDQNSGVEETIDGVDIEETQRSSGEVAVSQVVTQAEVEADYLAEQNAQDIMDVHGGREAESACGDDDKWWRSSTQHDNDAVPEEVFVDGRSLRSVLVGAEPSPLGRHDAAKGAGWAAEKPPEKVQSEMLSVASALQNELSAAEQRMAKELEDSELDAASCQWLAPRSCSSGAAEIPNGIGAEGSSSRGTVSTVEAGAYRETPRGEVKGRSHRSDADNRDTCCIWPWGFC